MRAISIRRIYILSTSLAAIAASTPAFADEAAADAAAYDSADTADAIVVTGQRTTYNNAALDETLIDDKSPIASAIDLIGTLPGVQVNEGDAFGFDDWSTTYSIRGYQTNLDTQQVGITIDGLPNGGSGYGGGSKANRFIDTANIGTVEVFQGTADIASRSNEALGGTINFVTADPIDDMRVRLSGSVGDYDASRYYGRFDTGLIGGVAKAWFSYGHQQATDWMEGSAKNTRDNFAMKFIVDTPVKFTGYASYDDAYENNYDQMYSPEQYAASPHQDGLNGVWTGVPAVDQNYRGVWGTTRKNFFAYLKAETKIADALDLKASVYYHDMAGRGDWAPPYIVNVGQDTSGVQSEINGTSTVKGTPTWWATLPAGSGTPTYFATNAAGQIVAPTAAGAIQQQSFRHTHYRKDRLGGTLDGAWTMQFGALENTLRGGVWYEDTHRREWRDWHHVSDTRVGPAYDATPYWTQYDRKYPQTTFKWYAEDQVQFGPVTANFGVKQFINHLDREDLFGESSNVGVKSKSKVLLSGGIQVEPMTGLDVFGGYSENFKALSDTLLEYSADAFSSIKPETAENWEAGARYSNGMFNASATWFKSKFSNQVIFVPSSTSAGPDYLSEGDGRFFNAGGIDSEGFELLANVRPVHGLTLYGSYTHIDAKYRGTGNAELDAEQGVTAGNRVAGIPKDMWVLSGTYNYGPVTLGLTGKYTGNRFVNASNAWTAKNSFITDLSVAVKGEGLTDTLKDLTFALNITNLTDEDYLGGISGNYAWIGTPRTMVFSVTADF
ncbi:TonB-dependent receptor [Novosphingobium resinovorum]|uniref:TonB-dependent receptor n=1 Tax=Novosphingobium TaxID=165696 RepID=UPI001B3C76D4|nr:MULTISPECIES: TonB-dependent receptor [Novosphingobium]MBF7010355.1 TonB-dependent receptor [Novosphingobium sp. HR1a]WJM28359.1 TonB-dependent receptor [Novosphingobium resinovorum]